MTAGAKMFCEGCGKNISMEGALICKVCDPSLDAIMERRAELKTPPLCKACFQLHQDAHAAATKTSPPS